MEQEKEKKRRTTLGLVKNSQVPLLCNLNEDPHLTGRIKHGLEGGKITRVGGKKEDSISGSGSEDDDDDDSDSDEDEGPEIMLLNESVFEKHAEIVNIGGTCHIW